VGVIPIAYNYSSWQTEYGIHKAAEGTGTSGLRLYIFVPSGKTEGLLMAQKVNRR
jgi:hypothetical protein